jgi:hypothetical protein
MGICSHALPQWRLLLVACIVLATPSFPLMHTAWCKAMGATKDLPMMATSFQSKKFCWISSSENGRHPTANLSSLSLFAVDREAAVGCGERLLLQEAVALIEGCCLLLIVQWLRFVRSRGCCCKRLLHCRCWCLSFDGFVCLLVTDLGPYFAPFGWFHFEHNTLVAFIWIP